MPKREPEHRREQQRTPNGQRDPRPGVGSVSDGNEPKDNRKDADDQTEPSDERASIYGPRRIDIFRGHGFVNQKLLTRFSWLSILRQRIRASIFLTLRKRIYHFILELLSRRWRQWFVFWK